MLNAAEKFKLERLNANVGNMTIQATCQDCGALFAVDLYQQSLKDCLEAHAQTCAARRPTLVKRDSH